MTMGLARRLGPLSFSKHDTYVCLGFAVLTGVFTAYTFGRLSPYIYDFSTYDFWFDSDPPRVFEVAINRFAPHHYSTSHHPLFSALIFPPAFVLRQVFHLEAVQAVGVIVTALGALVAATAYILFRNLSMRRLDSAVFTLLLLSSGAAIFWLPVLETFWFGGWSFLAALCVSAWAQKRGRPHDLLFLAIGMLTLAITTTNWMVGLALLVVFYPPFQAVRHGVHTLVLVMGLFGFQAVLFPHARSFLDVFTHDEIVHVFNPESAGIGAKAYSFLFHSLVTPEPALAYGRRLQIQGTEFFSSGVLSVSAMLLWAGLFAVGLYSAFRLRGGFALNGQFKTADVVLLSLLGQLVLTLTFGIESFLYSPHFAPLLVVLAAFGVFTSMRKFVLPAAGLLCVLTLANNLHRFEEARGLLVSHHQHEQAFTATVVEMTEPNELIVCGAWALKTTGSLGMKRLGPSDAPIQPLGMYKNPEQCVFGLSGLGVERSGWVLWYEDYSLDAVRAFRERGARYFATSYRYGLENAPEFFNTMDATYFKMTQADGMAIYDLGRSPKHIGKE